MEEIKKISPAGEKISPSQLARATTVVNGKIRDKGLSSSEIHFSRDHFDHSNLKLQDSDLKEQSKLSRQAPDPRVPQGETLKPKSHQAPKISPGDLVYVKPQGSKHPHCHWPVSGWESPDSQGNSHES